MQSGVLRDIVTLQSKSVSRDAYGGETITWTDEARVWANVHPLRGREYLAARQAQERLDMRVYIRYRSGVRPDWRLLWRGVTYQVTAVVDVDAKKRELELMCAGETPL